MERTNVGRTNLLRSLIATATTIAMVAQTTISLAAPAAPITAADPTRRVVVLEYRSDSSAMPDLPQRVSARLSALTSLHVVDLNGARQKYGATLDRAVVACAGAAPCLATVGAKIGVDDVVLVGISELGDVIVTLQRISVRERRVESRLADSLAQAATPTDDALAAYLARIMPATDFVRFGLIRVLANEDGAKVKVGDTDRGITPIEPLKLRAPSSYDIAIDKDGFVPFRATVDVPPDGEVTVRAELNRRGGVTHWYQHWWVIALAAGVTAGVILYFRDRDTNATVTGVIPAT